MDEQSKREAAETCQVFDALLDAQKLYEPYRELATVARLAAAHRPPESVQPSWDHPLGLVIRTSK
jgi:hypothetical protein